LGLLKGVWVDGMLGISVFAMNGLDREDSIVSVLPFLSSLPFPYKAVKY
jgi:hypothetical protein